MTSDTLKIGGHEFVFSITKPDKPVSASASFNDTILNYLKAVAPYHYAMATLGYRPLKNGLWVRQDYRGKGRPKRSHYATLAVLERARKITASL